MFKVENFTLIKQYSVPDVTAAVRYWDKAGTQDAGARTAGVLFLLLKRGFVIADVVKGQWSAGAREERIKQTAELDDELFELFSVDVWIEQEPGSGGKESAENTVLNLAGHNVYVDRVTGSKEVRANPYAAQVEAGMVSILTRSWTSNFIDEHELFPNGKFKDQVDAAAGAFNKLTLGNSMFIHPSVSSVGDTDHKIIVEEHGREYAGVSVADDGEGWKMI